MNLSRKYFFFDIDGTLTDEATKKIVPSAFLALQKLQQAEKHWVHPIQLKQIKTVCRSLLRFYTKSKTVIL